MKLTPVYYVYCLAMFFGWACAGISLAADYMMATILFGAIGTAGFFGTQTFLGDD